MKADAGNLCADFHLPAFPRPCQPLPTSGSFCKLVPAFPGFSGLFLRLPNGLADYEVDLAEPRSHIVPCYCNPLIHFYLKSIMVRPFSHTTN